MSFTFNLFFFKKYLNIYNDKFEYMKLTKITDFIEKYMILIVIIVSLIGLFLPKTFVWLPLDLIKYLLMIVMFCMGLTFKTSDFNFLFKHPKDLEIGFISQFLIMPCLAFLIELLFNLETGLFVGLIVVGTCPGGTASAIITYLSEGDVALSVGMTSFNTLIAPILTPLITYLFLRTKLNVDVISMFLSIIELVLIPITLGLIINHFYEDKIINIKKYLPTTAIIAIMFVVGIIISHNSTNIFSSGAIILAAVILLNLCGYLCGFLIAKANGMPLRKCKALSIEIGM